MRRIVVAVVAVVALILGVVQFGRGMLELFPGLSADRQVTAAARNASAAADKFAALGKDSYQTGTPPRETDPAVKQLLDQVFATEQLGATSSLQRTDLSALGDWAVAILRTGSVYIFSGTGVSDPSQAGDDPKLVEKVNQNVVTFSPEVGRYIDAQLTVMAATIDSLKGAVLNAEDAKIKTGLEKMRAGMVTTLSGVVSTVTIPGLADDWRLARLARAQAIGPRLGKFVDADQCRGLRDETLKATKAVPNADVQRGLKSFADSLACT